jgi:DNA-directed RNA polymerase specialized sigma54-like protein
MILDFIKDEPFKAPLKEIIRNVNQNMVDKTGDIIRKSDNKTLSTFTDKLDNYVKVAFSDSNITKIADDFKAMLNDSVFQNLGFKKYVDFYNGINTLIKGGLKDYFKNNIISGINEGFTLTKSNNDWFNNAAGFYFNQLKDIRNKFV